MTQRFSDGARAELAATVNSTDTTITITANGSLFPVANTDTATIGPGKDWFKLVLQDDTGWEIVYVRTHTAGSLTFSNVLRGRDGSTAREFVATSVVGQRPTAGDTAALVAHMEDTSAVDNTPDVDKPVSTAQKALISAVAADYYGDVDPTTDSKITVGPGFKWAHATPGLNKVRNVTNDGWVVTSRLFADLSNVSPVGGFKNRIVNSEFKINQRQYTSGYVTTINQETFDTWKVSTTAGVTYSTANGRTTVTIPSGQTLRQIIEGVNLADGVYTLSWKGTAQGRINGGAYGASGSVKATLVGGTNTTVEFNSGTLADVQLEPGDFATLFENVDVAAHLLRCSRYLARVELPSFFFDFMQEAGGYYLAFFSLPIPMRVQPTVVLGGGNWPTGTNLQSAGVGSYRSTSVVCIELRSVGPGRAYQVTASDTYLLASAGL